MGILMCRNATRPEGCEIHLYQRPDVARVIELGTQRAHCNPCRLTIHALTFRRQDSVYYQDSALPPSLRSSSRFPSVEDWLVSVFVRMSATLATETSKGLLKKPVATTTQPNLHAYAPHPVSAPFHLVPMGDVKEGIEASVNGCCSKNVLVNLLWSYCET